MKKKPYIGEYRWMDELGTGKGLMVYTDTVGRWVIVVGREPAIPKKFSKIPVIINRIKKIKA